MKTVQIKKMKVNIFEEPELKEKLNMNDKDINLVVTYQRTFPELLQDEDGFCIDGETLCRELDVKDDFTSWLLADRKSVKGKLIKYRCVENTDFVVNREISENSKGGRPKTTIKMTLECAKKIAMRQNNDKGDLVCDYVILMEKTLRKYESWNMIREPEKQEFNIMVDELRKWCERNNYEIDDKIFASFRARESNMINMNLTGKLASEIKVHIGYKDNITRDHLDEKLNSAILELQKLNTNLLIANMDFDTRNNLIKSICTTKYSDLFIK